jgi:hypothetical protein
MKKILTTLLIASITITGLFAYSSPSVILTTEAPEVDYNFKLQKLNAAMTAYEDFEPGQAEIISLTSELGTTNAFTISTVADGNMASDITFTALVTTGEFIDDSDDAIESGWYPVIEDFSASATTENLIRGNEIVNYSAGTSGDFTAASTGTYTTTFTRGIHEFGTEIARFKLQYKADDKIIAGTYNSITTIAITTE